MIFLQVIWQNPITFAEKWQASRHIRLPIALAKKIAYLVAVSEQ